MSSLSDNFGVMPASVGRDLFRHIYREGNGEADLLTHRAREGLCQLRDNTFEYLSGTEKPTGLRGYFDGGVDADGGVGCGWVLWCTFEGNARAGPPQWYRVADESFCIAPGTTVTDSELSAVEQLILAIHRFIWCRAVT